MSHIETKSVHCFFIISRKLVHDMKYPILYEFYFSQNFQQPYTILPIWFKNTSLHCNNVLNFFQIRKKCWKCKMKFDFFICYIDNIKKRPHRWERCINFQKKLVKFADFADVGGFFLSLSRIYHSPVRTRAFNSVLILKNRGSMRR